MTPGLKLLNEAGIRFNEYCDPKHRLPLPLGGSSPLAGQGSPLDSLALTNFVMEVELLIEEQGLKVNLTDGQALVHLGCAGSLATYLEERWLV